MIPAIAAETAFVGVAMICISPVTPGTSSLVETKLVQILQTCVGTTESPVKWWNGFDDAIRDTLIG